MLNVFLCWVHKHENANFKNSDYLGKLNGKGGVIVTWV
jgi:hypothetical protein